MRVSGLAAMWIAMSVDADGIYTVGSVKLLAESSAGA